VPPVVLLSSKEVPLGRLTVSCGSENDLKRLAEGLTVYGPKNKAPESYGKGSILGNFISFSLLVQVKQKKEQRVIWWRAKEMERVAKVAAIKSLKIARGMPKGVSNDRPGELLHQWLQKHRHLFSWGVPWVLEKERKREKEIESVSGVL